MSDFDECIATVSRPLYHSEFKELNWERLRPPGIRYKGRDEPAIGMFDTSRAPAATRETKPSPAFLTSEQTAKAARTRKPAPRISKPYSIASRCIDALRNAGDAWTPTRDMLDLANAHRPEHCQLATMANIYESLAPWRKRGMIETRKSATAPNGLVWRIKQ